MCETCVDKNLTIIAGCGPNNIMAYVPTDPPTAPTLSTYNPRMPAIAVPTTGGAPTYSWSVQEQVWK